MMKYSVTYNAPTTLTFIFIAFVVQLMTSVVDNSITPRFFTVGATMALDNPADYVRLFSHVLGHAGFGHLFGNAMLILLLGPILEEKYGSQKMVGVILVTALITGLSNVALSSHGMCGASSVVFAYIVLASVVNVTSGAIPLTFILVFTIYLGQEVLNAMEPNQISEMAHIVGGLVGAGFGFWMKK